MKKLEIGETYYYIDDKSLKLTIMLGKLLSITTNHMGTTYSLSSSHYDENTQIKPNTSIDDLIKVAVEDYKEILMEAKVKYEKNN